MKINGRLLSNTKELLEVLSLISSAHETWAKARAQHPQVVSSVDLAPAHTVIAEARQHLLLESMTVIVPPTSSAPATSTSTSAAAAAAAHRH